MTTKKEIRKLVKENLNPSCVGTTKNGNIVFRWSFFYTNGNDSSKYVTAIITLLSKHHVTNYSIVDDGEVWKNFKGGASVSNQSHWYVILEVNE